MTGPLTILLPGVGADHRLFEPQHEALSNLVTPAWIPPRRGETLPSYARRFAAAVPTARPMILGGVSFGGMVAYEMARSLRPDLVVLIGSCRSRRGLRPICHMASPLVRVLSPRIIDAAKPLAPAGLRLFTRLSQDHRELCATMFREMDSRFMRWALRALLNWDPAPLQDTAVRQIHGRRDRIIPARRVEADEIVPGGGHLINLTHAEQVNEFIEKAADMVDVSYAT